MQLLICAPAPGTICSFPFRLRQQEVDPVRAIGCLRAAQISSLAQIGMPVQATFYGGSAAVGKEQPERLFGKDSSRLFM
jgi:hypothetical protein